MESRKKSWVYFILFIVAVLVIGFRYHQADFDNAILHSLYDQNKKFEFEGVISSDPEDKKTYWRYEVSLQNILDDTGDKIETDSLVNSRNRGELKILAKEKSRVIEIAKNEAPQNDTNTDAVGANDAPVRQNLQRPTYGDQIRFTAKLAKPKLIEGEDGRDFDYEYFLQKDNIYYLADLENVRLVGINKAEKVTQVLYSIKQKFMQNVENLLPSPHAFLATGLIISGKGSLDKELQEQFQKVGLIHIVVLSGSNVSIVGVAISKFFSFLPKLWGGIFGSIGIILFGMMTGGGATVSRSVIMSIIGIYARLSERKNSAFISLMVAGSLMLIQNPKLLLHDPSFQLSFMATLGLIFLGGPIEELLKKTKQKIEGFGRVYSMSLRMIPESLVSLVATTIATQIFTLPFIIRFSGVVSLVVLPVNAIVLPFIPLTMLFVFLAGVISFMSPLVASVPAFVSWLLLSYELFAVGHFSALSFSSIKLPSISLTMFFILYFCIVLLVVLLNAGNIFKEKEAYSNQFIGSEKINTTPV